MPPQLERGGSLSPRSTTYSESSAPAISQRNPPISAGGMVSRLTRIPKYVVPQMRQTAIHAR